MTTEALLLCVTTMGRIPALRRLLDSLRGQLEPGDVLVLVAQDHAERVRSLADEFAPGLTGTILVTESPRGAARGRNVGVSKAGEPGPDAIVLFPNDTTWFPEGVLAQIRRGMRDAPAGAVTVRTPSGPRFRLPPPGTPLTRSTVWSVIEMGLAMRADLFRRVGGFDTDIGTGAATPWQAGEVTDLLLRALALEPDLAARFRWLEGVEVGGVEEGFGLNARERAWKLRAYGRGIGHLYRRHGFGFLRTWAFVGAGALIGIRRRGEYRIRDGWWAFLGRAEGVTGRVRSDSRKHAVGR